MAGTQYIHYGEAAPAGSYMCVDCFYVHTAKTNSLLPVCPKYSQRSHLKTMWRILTLDVARTVTEGESTDDVKPESGVSKKKGSNSERESGRGIAFEMGLPAVKEDKWR